MPSCFAGGFDNHHIGIKGMSMGSAMAGIIDDASAVYYNPGGLVFLQQGHLMMIGPLGLECMFPMQVEVQRISTFKDLLMILKPLRGGAVLLLHRLIYLGPIWLQGSVCRCMEGL